MHINTVFLHVCEWVEGVSSVDIKGQLGVDFRRSFHIMNMQASRDYVKPCLLIQTYQP